jgi:PRTRC genetic system protein B
VQNSRTTLLLSTYKPQLALMVYKADIEEYYLESHNVNEQGQIMEGKPLLQETLQSIVDVFFDERKNMVNVKGLLPSNLLFFDVLPGGNYKMIWHRPAEIRVMHFAQQLKLPTNKTWVPAMIYKVDRRQLSVYALRSNNRPTEKTKMFRAPFHNVGEQGSVCLGNAKVKKPAVNTYTALQQYWEDLFWLSEFTHFNGSDKPVKTDLNKVWKRLLVSKTKLKWSDLDELVPCENMTLKTILK